jgi:hypothetical protein
MSFKVTYRRVLRWPRPRARPLGNKSQQNPIISSEDYWGVKNGPRALAREGQALPAPPAGRRAAAGGAGAAGDLRRDVCGVLGDAVEVRRSARRVFGPAQGGRRQAGERARQAGPGRRRSRHGFGD